MKKFLAKILSGSLAVVLSLFLLNGCALVTTNAERDMAQVIATVELDPALKEDIYKRELVSAYNSQGAYYVQYMGMTVKEAYEEALSDIVRNRILKQQAKLAFTGSTDINKDGGFFAQASAIADENKSSFDYILTALNHEENKFTSLTKTDSIDKFFTEYEYQQIQYNVLSSIRNLVDGYKEEEDEHHHDAYETFQGTVRSVLTIPAEEEFDEYEMQDAEKGKVDADSKFFKSLDKINKDAELGLDLSKAENNYKLALSVYTKYCENFSLSGDRSEVNKLIRDLKNLGFITSEEASRKTPTTKEEILNLTYFKDALQIQYENALINKFELALQNNEEKKLASETELYNAYVNAFNNQKLSYANYTTYETALENANNSNLVLYNPSVDGKYGYIINLLIGFNAEQKAILDAVTENPKLTKAQKAKAREDLLKELYAKDLRSSWVESYYGNYKDGNFTFGDDYCKTDELKAFNGSIYGAKEYEYHSEYDEHEKRYTFDAVKGTEMPFETFYSNVVSKIMKFEGKSGRLEGYTDNDKIISDSDKEKFVDLVFAYSTDDGSLKDGYGYVYSPKTSSTKYVTEFAESAKNVVNAGVGSYEVVATEFGYHIILCTKVIEPTVSVIGEQEFKNQLTVKDSIPYLFKEYQKARLVVDNVDKVTEAFFKSNQKKVTYFESNYEDLLAE
ncbi:MAG: hypothetical protein E7358_05060 [Clostridiales bacterium]|nr:hypothetical protein [Clostridiales bacterium]